MTPSRTKIHWLAAAFALSLAAWGSPPPDTELATARSEIARARASDAAKLAPMELRAAEDKLARAQAARDERDYKDADALAQQAAADAELAQVRSRGAKARAEVAALTGSNEKLRRELLEDDAP